MPIEDVAGAVKELIQQGKVRHFLTCGGGIVAGWGLARVYTRLASRVADVPVSVLIQFLSTFAVWMLAERLGLSAILTVVAYAMTLARRVAGRMNARHRIASYAVWEVAVLVLNVLAFVLIGLQLRGILSRTHSGEWRLYALCAGAVCTAVIIVRIAWVMTHTSIDRWRIRRFGVESSRPLTLPSARNGLLASWCGMRGIVTLATALALPDGPSPFPHRDLIAFSAFCVVLSTLVIQGFTLRPLMQWLGLRDDGMVEREIEVARTETARAALRALEEGSAASPSATILRGEYQDRLRTKDSGAAHQAVNQSDTSLAALQRRAAEAQREALTDLRAR